MHRSAPRGRPSSGQDGAALSPEASLETVGERFRSASGQTYDELGRVDDDDYW